MGNRQTTNISSNKTSFDRAPVRKKYAAVQGASNVIVAGLNSQNQLGQPNITQETFLPPTVLPASLFDDDLIKSAACYGYHSVFVTERGKVYTCGANQYGQLGTRSTTS